MAGAIVLRDAEPGDTEECGRICYEAFRTIAEQHGYPPDFPSVEPAIEVVGLLNSNPGFYGAVAELEGRVVGSSFLDERSTIASIGPITVDPAVQDAGVGRALMGRMLERGARFPGVRLLQSAYHTRSLSLYSKLGFEVREPCVTMQGPAVAEELPGYTVAIAHGLATVVEHGDRIAGYSTGVAFFGHTVGESNAEVKALIAAASAYDGPGFLVPARNGELYRWCMARGLRVVHVMTLMTLGLYNEPAGAYLPSVGY
jgi:GNAT superfamily N-acetyltransferase